jgi:hypothetical protein
LQRKPDKDLNILALLRPLLMESNLWLKKTKSSTLNWALLKTFTMIWRPGCDPTCSCFDTYVYLCFCYFLNYFLLDCLWFVIWQCSYVANFNSIAISFQFELFSFGLIWFVIWQCLYVASFKFIGILLHLS